MFYMYTSTSMEVWLFVLLPAFMFALYAQSNIKSTFNKYSKINNKRGLTGAEVAKLLLEANGIYDVEVEYIKGNLSDHYDPRSKVIRLSDAVYGSRSLAGIGVAAHETGHAIQHNESYGPLALRHMILPMAQIGGSLAMPIFFAGFFITPELLYVGIILFTFTIMFQLVTLPVEFNASSRAMKILSKENIIEKDEIAPARKVLNAAALTYVAGVVTAVAQLIRLLVIANDRR